MFEEWEGTRAGGSLWDDETAAATQARRAPQVPERLDASEAARYLREHGASLPKRQAQAVAWFYAGKSTGRIAKDLDIAPSSVVTMIKRFRQKLRVGQPSCASK